MNAGLNAAKRDSVPPTTKVADLARQHGALWRLAGKLSEPARGTLLRTRDDYSADLGIGDPQAATDDDLTGAYRAAYEPLFGIARRMGFPDWRPEAA